MIELTINDRIHRVEAPDDMPLVWVLRDTLGLTGTKFGCGIGVCGACTVHVDGIATRSCVTPVHSVQDKSIVTIEGLSEVDADGAYQLHPIQQAFIDQQVPQCSWCMSGQMMTAAAFLEQNPQPNDEQIVAAMGANYCRCGCYVRIKQAIKQVVSEQETAS